MHRQSRWLMLTALGLGILSSAACAALPSGPGSATSTPAPAQTIAPRAANFSLVFEDFECQDTPVDVLDTPKGTLVHTPLGETQSTTIPFQLTDVELQAIYEKAMQIGFFGYPSQFAVPDAETMGFNMPWTRYRLSMTNGSQTNDVSWKDDRDNRPSYAPAEGLRALMQLIVTTIQDHPEYQQLPKPSRGCA